MRFFVQNGQASKIKRFGFFNVPAMCSGFPPTAVTGELLGIQVSHGKFSVTKSLNSGKTTYKVSGTFDSLHKATGTIRVEGTVSGCLHADTGVKNWKATG